MHNYFKGQPRLLKQSGFSLIELLLVMAVIAALAVAAFIIYPRVQAGRAATGEADIIAAAQTSAKSLFTTSNYNGLTSLVAAQANFFPASMLDTPPTTITNEWGGVVSMFASDVTGSAVPTGPTNFFTITYPSVPYDVCQKLLPALISNVGGVRIGGTVIQDTLSPTQVPFSAALVASNCGSTGTVTLTLTSN